MGELRPRPEPGPVAVLMAHAKLLVEHVLAAGEQRFDDFFKLGIVGMDALGHLAEIEELAFLLHSEDIVHRLRPEDAATRDVPVPQTAMAAVERLVEPFGGDGERAVGFGRLGRLPVKSAAEHHQDEEGDGEEQRHLGDALAPGAEHIGALLHDEQACRHGG